MISVNRKALYSLLTAVIGPSNYIKELQVTREIDKDNPIDILITQYNTFVNQEVKRGKNENI
jgi:hypothetical protein